MTSITLPAFSAFSFTNGFPASYVAPEEISTRIDYTVEDPNTVLVAVGSLPETGNEVVDLGANPVLGEYTITFTATHFDAAGDGTTSSPLVLTVTVSGGQLVLSDLTAALVAGGGGQPQFDGLVVRTEVTAVDSDDFDFVTFGYRIYDSADVWQDGGSGSLADPATNRWAAEGYQDVLRYNRRYEWRVTARDVVGETATLYPTDPKVEVTTGLIPPPTDLASSTPVTVTFS